MRVGIIGDVHGHFRELTAMVRRLEREGVDRIILLGDLCDRGPQSLRCVHYARKQTFKPRGRRARQPFEVVKGNHEDAYVRYWLGLPKPGRDRVDLPEYPAFYRKLAADDLNWMLHLPLSAAVDELGVVAVHGGVTPHDQEVDEFALRTRYLNERSLEQERGVYGDVFWADVYDGRFGTIVFGHESHAEVTEYQYALAIDGEGYQRLHAVILSNEPRDEWATALTIRYGQNQVQRRLIADRPERFHSFKQRRTPRRQPDYRAYSQLNLW